MVNGRYLVLMAACIALPACDVAESGPAAVPTFTPTAGRPLACTGNVDSHGGSYRLRSSDRVAAALVCGGFDNSRLYADGEWIVRSESRPTGESLAQLARAYGLPSKPRPADTICTTIGYWLPEVHFRLVNGTRVSVAAPHEICGKPLPEVYSALQAVETSSAARAVRVRRLRSVPAVAAGCSSEWKDVLTGIAHRAGTGGLAPRQPTAAAAGVCRYAARNGALVLVASGKTDSASINGLRPKPGPPRGCSPAVRGAVLVQMLARTPRPVLWVETDGCGRVTNGVDFRSVGWLPAADVQRIAALAGSAEH